MLSSTGWAAAIAVVIGCGAPASPQVTQASAMVIAGDCEPWGCGLNGAWLGENIPFRELDLGTRGDIASRRPNQAGLQIQSFRKAGRELTIDVQGDELIGRDGARMLKRADLEGAVLTLLRNGREQFLLRIVKVTTEPYWTDPCTQESADCHLVPRYTIFFKRAGDLDDREADICSPAVEWDMTDGPDYAPARGGQPGGQPPSVLRPPVRTFGTRPQIRGQAIVFRGDQYVEPGFQVHVDHTSTWFNIACRGTAVAKLHLLRHTSASRRDSDRITTREQRQSVLRMLTGDYCGIGYPFTRNGQPLSYTFDQDWRSGEPRPPGDSGSGTAFTGLENVSLDALWDEHGAVCIGTPRLAEHEPVLQLAQRIWQICDRRLATPPPGQRPSSSRPFRSCAELRATTGTIWTGDEFARTGSYVVSANPRPPPAPPR
jgi:hypothetical protein